MVDKMYEIRPKWVKLFGFLLDIIGTIIIAFAILKIQDRLTELNTLIELEEELEKELATESRLTLIGITLIFSGFLLILWEEIYSTFFKKENVTEDIYSDLYSLT